jgi:hypothetical protein
MATPSFIGYDEASCGLYSNKSFFASVFGGRSFNSLMVFAMPSSSICGVSGALLSLAVPIRTCKGSLVLRGLYVIVLDRETDGSILDLERASAKSFTVLAPTLRQQAFLSACVILSWLSQKWRNDVLR